MVTFNDVVNHIIKLLKSKFPTYKIYSDEIIENMTRPAFHVNLLPEQSINFNSYYRNQNCLVDISFFSNEEMDLQSKEKNLDMLHQLENVFNMEIFVKDRYLNINDLTCDIVDKVLHTTFNLMWYNENEVTLDYLNQFGIMKTFYINNEIIECKSLLITSDGNIYKTIDGEFYMQCTDDEVQKLKENNLI